MLGQHYGFHFSRLKHKPNIKSADGFIWLFENTSVRTLDIIPADK